AAALVASLEMLLKLLKSGRENHAVEIPLDQPVEIATSEHLARRRRREDAAFERGGFAEMIRSGHRAHRLDGHSHVAEQLAAFPAAQPVRRELRADAGFHFAVEVIRNRILEFNTVHEKHWSAIRR